MLAWIANCGISSNTAADQQFTFTVTDTTLFVSVVTLSAQNNAKL